MLTMRRHRTCLVGLLTALLGAVVPFAHWRTVPRKAGYSPEASVNQPLLAATNLAGVALPDGRAISPVAWDIDRDGDLDVVGSTVEDAVVIWINDGHGHHRSSRRVFRCDGGFREHPGRHSNSGPERAALTAIAERSSERTKPHTVPRFTLRSDRFTPFGIELPSVVPPAHLQLSLHLSAADSVRLSRTCPLVQLVQLQRTPVFSGSRSVRKRLSVADGRS
jgi:hypothetical protein